MSPILEKLTDNMKKATIIASSGNIRLPAMRMMYPTLFTPGFPSKREQDPKKKRWSVTGLIPAGFDLSALEQGIDEIINEELTEQKRQPNKDGSLPYNFPILKTAGINSLADYADDYPFCVRLGARAFTNDGKRRPAPQVINAKGVEIPEADEAEELYNGRWFMASTNPFWYPPYDGKPGVSLGLVNVQTLYNDDPLAGGKPAASSEFAAVDIDEDEEEVNEELYA